MRPRTPLVLLCAVVVLAVPATANASRSTGSSSTCPTLVADSVTNATGFQSMFDTYGNDDARNDDWSGADGVYSVKLPGGGDAWDFADTFLGPVNADGSRPGDAPLIHNDLVIQRGVTLVETIRGGTASAPSSLFSPADTSSWYWVGDETVEGDQLRVFLPQYTRTGPGAWDWAWSGTEIGSVPLGGGTPTVTAAPSAGGVTWGSALFETPGATYVYGVEDLGLEKYLHLARARAGGLLGPWQYWTGAGWSSDPASSARILDHVDTGFGVVRIGTTYALITLDTSTVFGWQIVMYTSCAPTGPWTGPTPVFSTPENAWPTYTYSVHVHPEFTTSAGLLVSYDVNSSWANVHSNVELYRPRFLRVHLTASS